MAFRLLRAAMIAALLCAPASLHAQSGAPKQGAAEKKGKAWPYPAPAVPGATGYAPIYADFTAVNERFDIYANLLWRKSASPRRDAKYYDGEIADFLTSIPSTERARFEDATSGLLSLIRRIRAKSVTLPHRDGATGCLFFIVRHEKTRTLAADDCAPRG